MIRFLCFFLTLLAIGSSSAQIVLPSGQPDPSFPNLAFWLDADDEASFWLDGDQVNSWTDRAKSIVGSANGTITRQTNAINGHATVVFDGTGFFALDSTVNLTCSAGQSSSAFVVAKTNDASGGDTLMSRADDNVQFFRQNDSWVHFYKSGSGYDPIIKTDTLDQDRIRYAELNSEQLRYFVNGSELHVDNSANLGPQDWVLDRVGGGGGCCGTWGGDIAEILIFDRALDANEKNAVGAYLAAKYNIATSYPPSTPVITSFTATYAGATGTTIAVPENVDVTVQWQVTGANSVELSAGIGSVHTTGSTIIPSGTGDTTYTLSATNSKGTSTAEITVLVMGAPVQPFISEFLANPDNGTLEDVDGDSVDWIEISNPNPFPINLGGLYLSDDLANPTKWQIPSPTNLAANGQIVIFASGKDRVALGSNFHTNFKLSSTADALTLFDSDGSTILSSFTWTAPESHPSGASYGLDGDPAVEHFYLNPSPGLPNSPPYYLAGKVIFSLENRSFADTLNLSLAPEFSGLEIRYTTDGSIPTVSSPVYSGPLTISNSTLIRARLSDPADSNHLGVVSGRQFIKLAPATISSDAKAGSPNLAGFTSNLPIIVLDNFGGPEVGRNSMVATTFSVFEPVEGLASLTSMPSVSTRAGYRIRGASSAYFPKKQYGVELWNQDDQDKKVSLLDLPADSDWVLSAPYTDKSLIRNPFIFALGREIGIPGPRTRHCEVFINEDGGDLNYDTDYKGVYILVEKIKISKDRANLTKLNRGDNSEPAITGGYIGRQEAGASSAADRLPNTSHTEIVDPDGDSQATSAQKRWLSDYLHVFDDALDGPDFKDPILGYQAYIDVDSFVNLFVINELTRDQDAYMRSNYFYKDRNSKLFQGPLWDYNLTMGNGCCRNTRSAVPTGDDTGWQYKENDGANEWNWEVRLDDDIDFWQKFIDRWQELRRDALSDSGLAGRMDIQAAGLASPAIRNFAKWDNLGERNVGFETPQTQTWEEQIDFMKIWSSERMAWIDSNFTTPPNVSPVSGTVPPGSSSTVDGSEGTIYFTTDGSDPRLPGGAINPIAQAYSASGFIDVLMIARADIWRYLDDGSDQGSSEIVAGTPGYTTSHWTHPGYDDSNWGTGDAPLGYGNPVTTGISYGGDSQNRHITYYFRKSFTVTDVASFNELRMEIQYDDGTLVYLNGKLVNRQNLSTGPTLFNTRAIDAVYGAGETEWHTVTLDPADLVEGQNIVSVELHQSSSRSSDINIDFSLTGKKTDGSPPTIPLTATTTITARALDGSDWSGPVSQTYIIGAAASASNLVISEIHYNPAAPAQAEIDAGFSDNDDFEFLEVRNVSSQSIELSLVQFSEGLTFTFPACTQLVAGESLLIVRNQTAFTMRYPGVPASKIIGEFQVSSGLGNGGDTLTLLASDDSIIQSFTYDDVSPWPTTPDGTGFSLVLVDPFSLPDHNSPLSWRASFASGGNPATTDSSNFPGGDLLSYATGGNPASVRPLGGDLYEFTVSLNLRAEDLSGLIEVSPDLSTWSPGTDLFTKKAVESNSDGTSSVTFQTKSPLGEPRWFVRYRINLR